MRKVDQEDQSNEDEEKGSDGYDVTAVEHEEFVGDQESQEAEQEE